MQNCDKAFPGISKIGHGQMLITLKPHGICQSFFAYLYILTLSRH